MSKEFVLSEHFKRDKEIEADLAADCIQTGRKQLEAEPNKFKSRKKYRKGELIVVYRDYVDYFFIITAFWNERGDLR